MCVNKLWDVHSRWDETKIRSTFGDSQDIMDIQKIYIPQSNCEDKRIWPHARSEKLP